MPRMSTRFHYEFFRSVCKEEDARYDSLIDRGKIYLSIISIFFGGVFFKLDWIFENRAKLQSGLPFYAAGILSIFIALVLVALALQVLSYEAPSDLNSIIDNLELDNDESEFINARISELAVANERNILQNDRRATLLQGALISILVGVLMLVIGISAFILT
jgi:hypothetical protein